MRNCRFRRLARARIDTCGPPLAVLSDNTEDNITDSGFLEELSTNFQSPAAAVALRPRSRNRHLSTKKAISAAPISIRSSAARSTQASSGAARPRNTPVTQSFHDQRLRPAVKTPSARASAA